MSVGMETQTQPYRLGEYHSFSAAGTEFLYLVPSGSIFAVEGIAKLVIELLGSGEMPREALVAKLLELGCSREEVENTLQELTEVDALQCDLQEKEPLAVPVQEFPLQRIVLNTTNQCNLACTYCYEYSEDKIVDTENGKKSVAKVCCVAKLVVNVPPPPPSSSIWNVLSGGLVNEPAIVTGICALVVPAGSRIDPLAAV